LKAADKVIVPFRPDYVSQLAVDRIALLIEDTRNFDDLQAIPLDQRRYACVANYVRDDNKDYMLIEEIALVHPMLDTFLPQRDGIANAFDWIAQPRSLESKYGDASGDVKELYSEISRIIEKTPARPKDKVSAT
jgi:cellulose biosynthesis protein BcsQ